MYGITGGPGPAATADDRPGDGSGHGRGSGGVPGRKPGIRPRRGPLRGRDGQQLRATLPHRYGDRRGHLRGLHGLLVGDRLDPPRSAGSMTGTASPSGPATLSSSRLRTPAERPRRVRQRARPGDPPLRRGGGPRRRGRQRRRRPERVAVLPVRVGRRLLRPGRGRGRDAGGIHPQRRHRGRHRPRPRSEATAPAAPAPGLSRASTVPGCGLDGGRRLRVQRPRSWQRVRPRRPRTATIPGRALMDARPGVVPGRSGGGVSGRSRWPRP